jgi:type IX secretion system PorP/SprF family membrane protein
LKNKAILSLMFLFCIAFSSRAQDIHFTQFFNSPLTSSPSNTGDFDGDWRLCSNYRSQWKQIDRPYLTQSLSFDKQLYIFNENFSIGGLIVNDRSAGTLKVNKFLISAGYKKRINRLTLSGGIQTGYVIKQIVPPDETFHEQFNWNTGHFDKSLPNQESALQESLGYLDLNVGFGCHYRLNKNMINFSAAVYHVNYPNESFTGDFKLKPKKTFTASFDHPLNDKINIEPMLLLTGEAKAHETLTGFVGRYKLDDSNASHIDAGLLWRYGVRRESDGGQLYVGYGVKTYKLGISYDVNTSSLHPATSYRGAFEIAFIYTALNTRLKKTEVPCERY